MQCSRGGFYAFVRTGIGEGVQRKAGICGWAVAGAPWGCTGRSRRAGVPHPERPGAPSWDLARFGPGEQGSQILVLWKHRVLQLTLCPKKNEPGNPV
uniref:Uncharacterized protein n=1 Tax=Sphaerodactylus townsendi TaxID=933632 RepID=A0ACB8FT49_9SAUR